MSQSGGDNDVGSDYSDHNSNDEDDGLELCDECGVQTDPHRDGFYCGRCEEVYCQGHADGIDDIENYANVWLEYDLDDHVFCAECIKDMKQECLDASPEDKERNQQAFRKFQAEWQTHFGRKK
jgi:hypothetical protein